MNFRIDNMSLRDSTLTVEGWAIGSHEKKVKFRVTDLRGNEIPCTVVDRDRADVMKQFGADLMCGFTVTVPFERTSDGWLILTDGPETRRIRVNETKVQQKNSVRNKRAEKLLALCRKETLQVAWDFYRENGLAALAKKSLHKIRKIDGDYDYPEWEARARITAEELEAQRGSWTSFARKPRISVVIPAYNTGEQYLKMLFDSLRDQTYPNLEIIIADGSDRGDAVRRVTSAYARAAKERNKEQSNADSAAVNPDDRIRKAEQPGDGERNKAQNRVTNAGQAGEQTELQTPEFIYVNLNGNLGIAGNTNAGLKAATGDYIALCDHDDELPLSAFYAVVRAINENPDAKFIYTDEDKIDFDGKAVFEPHFKSDYNPELLTSVNYICHLSVIRRDLLETVGGFRSAYDGAQDYDFFLRCMEEATAQETEQLEAYRKELKRLLKEQAADRFSQSAGSELSKQSGTAGSYVDTKTCGQVISGNICLETDLLPTEENLEKLSKASGFSKEDVQKLLEGRFTSAAVIHVPEICYHWRFHKGSTAENPQSKLYAFEAGARAIKTHLDLTGVPCETVEKGITYGFYHVIFPEVGSEDPKSVSGRDVNSENRSETENCSAAGNSVRCSGPEGAVCGSTAREAAGTASFSGPENEAEKHKLSIIIPNKDHAEDLDKCMRSIVEKSKFTNIEFVVVENNSEKEETFDYYRKIDNNPQYLGASENSPYSIRVVTWKREFNYSAINNFGAAFATGDLLLLLNNDVEIISPDSITEMVNYSSRQEIGAVGAKLTYADDTVQHAGVIVGLGGIAGAAFVGLHEKETSYMHRMACVQDYSAVTAACLMLRKEVFEEVGGLREELAVAFNDIDLCMKIRARGYRVVYDPYSTWHHYESKSRGLEDTPEKVRRFNNEIALFASHWGGILQKGDPYYHPALTLRKANFALKDLTKEKIGEPFQLELDVEEQLKTVQREKQRRERSGLTPARPS